MSDPKCPKTIGCPAVSYFSTFVPKDFRSSTNQFAASTQSFLNSGSVEIDFIFRNSYKLYALLVVLLLVTIFFGIEINYSKRWISLGFITFQPSEIGKILFVFAIAKFLSNKSQKQYGFKTIFVLYFLAGTVFLIIIQQPDLGTSLVYFFCIFPMMYWAGVKLVDILLSFRSVNKHIIF